MGEVGRQQNLKEDIVQGLNYTLTVRSWASHIILTLT